MGKNSKSSKNIYSQRPGNKKSKYSPQLRRNSYENKKILRKFAFQILQKWAGKEGSSALAVLKGFVLILVFEFSVATRNFHHVPCKSHIQYKYLDISWTYGNAESTNILQNLQMLCRIYPSIVVAVWQKLLCWILSIPSNPRWEPLVTLKKPIKACGI